MKPLSTDEIRSLFLEFFRERGHEVVASSSLVPAGDPTLLFTNAGMVQFKDVFTGKERRPYVRAASAQKCVRAGGKHNDLENVGYTARHHTFFEMLGNFSFGDYFKADAITYAWDFCTRVLGLPTERLAVTVFKGEEGIPADDEAAVLWERAGVPKNRIFRFGKADNFWQMGDTGPQGPCSELHYYLGDLKDPDHLTEERVGGSKGWLEIWNLVFMQFQKETPTSPLEPLPKPSIDTGAGLERLAFVLQGTKSNYETDLFLPVIQAVAKEVGKTYGGFGSDNPDDVALRVVADHARATAFLIADHVLPSNEGREYVLRRIMRRAIRYGKRLGFEEPFFHRACLLVVDRMGRAYPELMRARSVIAGTVEREEISFRGTLDRGLKLLGQAIDAAKTKGQPALAPELVAKLYHTDGFPIDLTRVIAEEQGLAVDETAAQEAVVRSNPTPSATGLPKTDTKVWLELRERAGGSAFLGYQHDTTETAVKGIVVGGRPVDRAGPGEEVAIVLRETPFYGESGGQVGDRGTLEWKGLLVRVSDSQKPLPDMVVHLGRVEQGTIAVGQEVEAKIDRSAREATRKNHSATHLLHLALKETLGERAQQKGSLVGPDRLRFDYSHYEPLSPEQIERVERRVNEMILEDAETVTEVATLDRAREAGATMLFGEKYGDQVRMVRIGKESLELCGGTHVRRAGEVGLFKIVSDGALASGVRRIEAVTGLGGLVYVQHLSRILSQASSVANIAVDMLPDRLEKLLRRTKELERDLEKAKAEAALGGGAKGDLLDRAETIQGIRVLVHQAEPLPPKALREMSDKLRDRIQSGVVALATVDGDKASLLVAVTKDLAGKAAHAGELVKAATLAMEGSGGGRPDFAQGGGKGELLPRALEELRRVLHAAKR